MIRQNIALKIIGPDISPWTNDGAANNLTEVSHLLAEMIPDFRPLYDPI